MLRSEKVTNESSISAQALKQFIIPNKLKYTGKCCIYLSLSVQCAIQKVISCITEEMKIQKTVISTGLNPILFDHLAFTSDFIKQKDFSQNMLAFLPKEKYSIPLFVINLDLLIRTIGP